MTCPGFPINTKSTEACWSSSTTLIVQHQADFCESLISPRYRTGVAPHVRRRHVASRQCTLGNLEKSDAGVTWAQTTLAAAEQRVRVSGSRLAEGRCA